MPLDQPLELKSTLESGQAFRWQQDGEWWWGVVGRHAYALRQVDGGLDVRSSSRSMSAAVTELHDFLRLDDDLDAVYQRLAVDQPLAKAVERYRGMRILRQEPWECLASFLCTPTSNISRISANLKSVAETYGETLTLDGHRLYRFPGASRLAEAGEKGLRGLGLGFHGKFLAQAAKVVADGQLDLMALRSASYQEAKTALLELPGVGDKVADCVLLFSLEKLDGFPVDRWVRRALVDWYGHPEKAKYRDLLEWAQTKWGSDAGYVQQYLFHHRRLQDASDRAD